MVHEDVAQTMFRIPVDESLDLVLLEPRHGPMLYAVVDENRKHLRRFLPWVDGTRSVNDSAAFIQSCLDQFARGVSVNVGIFTRGQLIGLCGTHMIQWSNRRTELGYWLSERWQGKGLMTRAVHALGTHCVHSLALNRLEIRAATDNVRSRKIAERLGFKLEGVSRQAEWLYDHFVDHAIYGILASEWR
jgi:ribosomal-protein-serine acetyltransferase